MNLIPKLIFRGSIALATMAANPLTAQEPASGSGGGPIVFPLGNCISKADRLAMQARIKNHSQKSISLSGRRYSIQPIAGNIWDDVFISNYVDMDPTKGIRDWDCTEFTYDGHLGHDISLRSFGDQDIGVPIFAALDGQVVDLHDGEPDRNTAFSDAKANYVVLDHGQNHYTQYYHLRKNSVAVTLNQIVTAGTQLGLAASSGYSTGPHLHFETTINETTVEPYSGPCHTNESVWVHQIPIRRDLYVQQFAMHNTSFDESPFLPHNPKRNATFLAGQSQKIGCWFVLKNLPTNSTVRMRYVRPNGTEFFDTDVQSLGAESANYSSRWFFYNLEPDVLGTWNLELFINSKEMLTTPFYVILPGAQPTNHPPDAIASASFDPETITPQDVPFVRIRTTLFEDPDYDLVGYRYRWYLNGSLIREITSASHSDAIPRGTFKIDDVIRCQITPYDGTVFGTEINITNQVKRYVGPALTISRVNAGALSIKWPVTQNDFLLEVQGALAPGGWTTVAQHPVRVGDWLLQTNFTPASPFFLRLRGQ